MVLTNPPLGDTDHTVAANSWRDLRRGGHSSEGTIDFYDWLGVVPIGTAEETELNRVSGQLESLDERICGSSGTVATPTDRVAAHDAGLAAGAPGSIEPGCPATLPLREDGAVTPRTDEPDYQLVWPRTLFKAEAVKLLDRRGAHDWDDQCEHLLGDAFVGGDEGGPRSVPRGR
ncbi:hypothetical protein GCM10023175_43320 [Pseudonocardia xishanensis]|uniref:Uncharacterized protein n=1 Tax=Pseudonocardia xishanensis TaxID=630995 RepID=A0ABP8RVS1_9PSEU